MTASTWEDRMAARAAERARELAEANEREDMTLIGADHLHGTARACPCGAETGIACVVFEDGWVQPDPCETCGKPVDRFCDGRPHREVPKHAIGCPEHPESIRCASCGRVPWTGMMSSGQGWYCMDCTAQAPGVTPLDLSQAAPAPPVSSLLNQPPLLIGRFPHARDLAHHRSRPHSRCGSPLRRGPPRQHDCP